MLHSRAVVDMEEIGGSSNHRVVENCAETFVACLRRKTMLFKIYLTRRLRFDGESILCRKLCYSPFQKLNFTSIKL